MRKSKPKTKKELQEYIELLDEVVTDGDLANWEYLDAQCEYKKRFGKEHEW